MLKSLLSTALIEGMSLVLLTTKFGLMSTKRQFNYKIGDRVAERPKIHAVFATRSESIERIKQYRTQRYGEVVGINYKRNSRGNCQRFLLVKWDHLNTATEHSVARICPVSELERLTNNTIVPGE